MALMNTKSPAGLTTSVLIADTVNTTGAGTDSIATMTTGVNATSGLTVPVSAALEIQSTQGALLLPRLTTAQLTATTFTPVAGMQAFNSTSGGVWSYATLQATAAAVSAAGGWGVGGLSVASGTLTTAQIAAMYATPCLLLPAPPLGYMYSIISWTLNAVNAVAAWGGGGVIAVQYGSAANGAGPLASATLAATMFTTAGFAHRIGTAAGVLVNDLSANYFDGTNAHAGIYISNQTAAFTTAGGVVGTAKWFLTYMVIPVS